MNTVQTERLILRQWRSTDKPLFSRMNADPRVMEFFPSTLSKIQSDHSVDRFRRHIDDFGWGFWATERVDTAELIGFIGINYSADGLPFAPCVDIGWRLAYRHWGMGFATEGARAARDYAFEHAGLQEIVSMTPTLNVRSEHLMNKLGLIKQPENFFHPKVAQGDPLREHVLYRMYKDQWQARYRNK